MLQTIVIVKPLNDITSTVSDTSIEDLPQWRRILYTLCGYEPPRAPDMSGEESAAEQTNMHTSIHESGRWKWFVNINAIILMTFGIFLWGFFG